MATRVKTPYIVITFPTTVAAMAFEAAAAEHGIPGRTIPVPSAISAGCGLSWCAPAAEREQVEHAIEEYGLELYGLEFEAVHVVELY